MSPEDIREEAFTVLGRIVTRSDPSRLEAWAELGLTMTQLRVLFMVRTEEGVSAGSLADNLGVTPSTLTRIMDRLVANRLVRRDTDESDRRLVRHHLTQTGRRTVDELEKTGRARLNAILARLTPAQIERLVMALRDFSEAAEAIDERAGLKVEA